VDQFGRARERADGAPCGSRSSGHRLPDARWDERPLACVVVEGEVDPNELREFLAARVAKWQVPDNWSVVDAIPKTSVGKFDKKALRVQYEKGVLALKRV
jgi:fatty-acyl-CoA synthase